MTSDSPDPIEQRKVQLMAQVVGGCLRDAERREVRFDPGMLFTVPSEWVMERARREDWSPARIAAVVPKYEYEYWKHRETDGVAEITLRFKQAS
ncbi:MAG: hypothetical protein H0T47_16110 [Planctomycetaceae bacterium]|nr:hypothetical protein [Planctomycetaceae bacterium]